MITGKEPYVALIRLVGFDDQEEWALMVNLVGFDGQSTTYLPCK